jgi:hypothetical protein
MVIGALTDNEGPVDSSGSNSDGKAEHIQKKY